MSKLRVGFIGAGGMADAHLAGLTDTGVFPDIEIAAFCDVVLERAQAQFIPEAGTATEVTAMNFHAVRNHPSFTPEGVAANFVTNGRPPVGGAPFSDPCIDDFGNPAGVAVNFRESVGFDIPHNIFFVTLREVIR